MSSTASILVNLLMILLASIVFLTSLLLLCLIIYHRQRFPINTPMFLICNTSVSIIFVSICLIDMYARYVYAELNINVIFDDWWCYLRAYFIHVSVWLLFYSYVLQAIFRFFRVIFYQRKQWQTRRFMLRFVVIQWLIGFLCILPFLLLNYFQYIPDYYYCELLFTDIKGLVVIGVITYNIPMLIMTLLYTYILHFMKKTKTQSVFQNRHQANQRDLVVVRRILIQSGILMTLGLPATGFFYEYIATGYVSRIAYRVGWSLFTVSAAILPTLLVFITPQLRELITVTWRPNRRVQPTIA